MKTDIQIAQEAVLEPITEVAKQLQISEDELELYGKYKAKISDDFMEKIKDNPDGKLILVTAINPTPAGEGKTTTSVGLGQAFGKLGKKAVIALREPSLGPCFGVKGGAAGGGYAQVVPMEDLNLHFTGDFHAITSANNLLAAMLDNHIQQGNELQIDTRSVSYECTMFSFKSPVSSFASFSFRPFMVSVSFPLSAFFALTLYDLSPDFSLFCLIKAIDFLAFRPDKSPITL